ncbi:MAG: LPS assembly lipoprotein LptE [Robiginitomaculum sp.]
MQKLFLAFTFISMFFLNACGFKPMHAPNSFGGKTTGFTNISVKSEGNDKEDFLLKQALRNRLGDNGSARYVLTVDPKLRRGGLGIGSDDVGSRYDLYMVTGFNLADAKTGNVLFRDTVTAISTFASPRDPYGTVSAQNNAAEQVSKETSDRILVRVASYIQTDDGK